MCIILLTNVKKYNIIVLGLVIKMLIGFKIKNFRSFKDLQYFSLLAGKVRSNEFHIIEKNNQKILKFSGIFGANGSGKSNLILAMSIGQSLIRKGINKIINNQYYRGTIDEKNKNSYFEYELALNGKLYSYGFEINIYKNEIVSEWLIDMTKNKEKVIFERDLNCNTYKSDIINKKHSNFTNCLAEMQKNNQTLFLSEMTRRLIMSSNTDIYFNDIFSVFKFLTQDTIIIRPSTHKLFDIDYIKNKEKIIKILKALDIDIIDFISEKNDIKNIKNKLADNDYNNIINDIDAMSIRYPNIRFTLRIENDLYTIKKQKDNSYEVCSLKFLHKNNSTFGAYEESDGTIRILELIDILLTNNKLFLIDELDSSLHPILVDGLLKIFLKSRTTNQLIITTHELKTLDFDLVRRDEIWFTEKDEEGATRLYSLEEFKDVARFDRKIDKAYLEGRFGAIANIDTNYEN